MTGRIVTVFSGGGTGGHLYPALALASALTERRPDVTAFFVGAERGIEARVLPERGVDHLLVPVEGVRRGAVIANLRVARALGKALARVAAAFYRLRPHLVVVTGGYAGGPAGLMAVLTRTRLVLQEQNSVPGLTTRVLSLFAREVHVAFPEAVERLPRPSRRRALVSGNPVQPPRRRTRAEAAAAFGLNPDTPVALVVGGSQGSLALNDAVREAIGAVAEGRLERPPGLQLLWSTGPTHLSGIEAALRRCGNPDWVRAVGYIEDMPLALSITDLAVSRAGAMATSEFLAWGVPSILVPLPTAAADHQTRNASVLSEAGAARHLPESELTGETLWSVVAELVSDADLRRAMGTLAEGRGRPRAASEIAASLDRLLPPVEASA